VAKPQGKKQTADRIEKSPTIFLDEREIRGIYIEVFTS